MYTTVDREGIVNNYAQEPKIYFAIYPSPEQQRNYALQGGFAILLLMALVLTSFAVS